MDEATKKPVSRRRRRAVGRAVGAALIGGAVVTELRKPKNKRTWNGKMGFIPYDLRPPTVARARSRMWNEKNKHLFVPTVWGVGWTVNLAELRHKLRQS